MKVTTIGQGQTLFKEGAKCDVIYFIKSGQVEISRIDEETGKKIILKTLGPESVVGTMAFLLGLERSATAVCLTEVKCIEIKEAQRDVLLKQIPPWLKSMWDLVGIIRGRMKNIWKPKDWIHTLENKVKKLTKKLEATQTIDSNEDATSKEDAARQGGAERGG